ncbi:MAG: glycosyltransferase family 4 protein [Kiritimatiellia bacterium]
MIGQQQSRNMEWGLPAGTPKRWLIVTQNYAPERGASQTRLGILAGILKELGLEVEVFTGMPNYPTGVVPEAYRHRWTCSECIDGIPVHRTWVYAYGGCNKARRIANFLSFTLTGVVNMFRLRRPDLLFIESFPLPVGLLGLLAKAFWGVPYIYNIPDLQIEAAREMWIRNKVILWLASCFEDMVIRAAWRVSTVTWRFREYYNRERNIPLRKMSMLPNGADTRFLRYLEPDPGIAARYGVSNKIVFLYAGTLAAAHAPHVMIQAAELLKDRDEIRILIIGGGPERARIMKAAEDRGLANVVFGEESFNPQELPGLMSIARAALVTLSNTPVHRMLRVAKTFPPLACRKPVIFSGDCESGDLIKANDCGIVVPPETVSELAGAIIRLADDEQEAERLGVNGLRFIEREMTWVAIVRQWLEECAGHGFPSRLS